MILLGMAGFAGAGKDTIAEYLRDHYGFRIFSFSDALYREVATAFGLDDETLLRDRATKDAPQEAMSLQHCADAAFVRVMDAWLFTQGQGGAGLPDGAHDGYTPSPRQILQWWGTEYRRAQDPDYWVKQAEQWLNNVWAMCAFPEHRPQLFVNVSVRFENERRWIHSFAAQGNVWHVRRDSLGAVNGHVSETPLPVLWDQSIQINHAGAPSTSHLVYEREIFNNDTVPRLHDGIDLMLRTAARFVRVEPMLPDTPPEDDPLERVPFFTDADLKG